MSSDNKTGRPAFFDRSLGNTTQKTKRFPPKVWSVLAVPENKIALNEMAMDAKFEKEVQQRAAEQKEKRLLQEKKDKLSAEMQKVIAEEEQLKSKKPRP